MRSLSEYIKLLPTMIKNPDKIVEGIVNNTKLKLGQLQEDEVEEIIRRRVICAGCPFMSKNAKELGLYNGTSEDEFCVACGCELAWKTSCLSCDCGLTSHNKKNPKNQLPLKWTAYDKTKIQKQDDTQTS